MDMSPPENSGGGNGGVPGSFEYALSKMSCADRTGGGLDWSSDPAVSSSALALARRLRSFSVDVFSWYSLKCFKKKTLERRRKRLFLLGVHLASLGSTPIATRAF